ncbi:Hypothetical protein R9X50_00737600 [Acrodontium crateriforme]|uniref:Postreplication repair E3 ubiquitin-protein ligase RAD18 n=1 Tax=Acrodontium crateriforme TaxID=150365 RepID=A0AAQ3RCQ6_9PEZI|nr:Hypothetical protein R9X50_00737600 [Acrodontium crateriforme]
MASSHDIPDSTDWLSTPLSSLAALENALHCEICKEFYDTPMITSCNHTFCSKCIRTSLSNDGKCPACRSADQASKLRNNWALQEVVASFLAGREEVLRVARERGRKGKRKRIGEDEEDGGRVTRSKSQRLAASQTSQAEAFEIEGEEEDDGDFEPEPVLDDGLVECPLGCGKRMAIEAVEPHLDRCEDEKKQTSQPKPRPINGFGTAPKTSTYEAPRPQDRLSELNYAMIKETALRKKFTDLGIPNWGSKQLMVKRHTEWVNLWNANCDSNRPRTTRQLLQDLDTWERTQGGKATAAQGQNSGVMRKDFDGVGWQNKHQDEFSRLIAEARKKKNTIAVSPTKSEVEVTAEPLIPNDNSNRPVEQATETEIQQCDSTSQSFTSDHTPLNGALQSSGPAIPPTTSNPQTVTAEIGPALAQTTDFTPTFHQQFRPDEPDELPSRFYNDGAVKKVPMFAVPQQPVRDVDENGGALGRE